MTPPQSGADEPAYELLEQYVVARDLDACAPEVRAYVIANPVLRQAVDALKTSWAGGMDEGAVEREHGLRRILTSSAMVSDSVSQQPHTGDRVSIAGKSVQRRARSNALGGRYATRRWGWIVGSAAAALALILISRMPRVGQSGSNQTYTTTTGQQARLTLSDGTHVVLAPQTILRVAFDAGTRMVTLNGEAYFDVANAAGAPFTVRTGAVDTRVLGTAFLVQHYTRDSHVRVAVTSGKVAIVSQRGPAAVATITAGCTGIVTDSGIAMSTTNVAGATGWLDGRLVFREAPVAEVLDALSHWYGYEFRVADPAISRQNMNVIMSTQSSAAALSTLKLFLNVELTFDGNVVTLTPRRKPVVAPPMRRSDRDAITTHTNEVGR